MGGFLGAGAPQTFTVGTDGDYATITAAYTAVASNGILLVKNGTYQEHITITEKPCMIKNYYGHAPIINGSDTTNPAFTIHTNCVLRGLNIVGSHDLGVGNHFNENNIVVNAGMLTLQNCTLSDFNHCGVKIFQGGKLRAIGNTISGGGWTTLDHGIYISAGDAGGHIVADNEITGATGWGLHLYSYEFDAIVSGNNIHDNIGGIIVTGENHTITGNTITNNLGGKGINFFHYGLINLTVTGNTLSGNTSHDLFLDASEGEGFTNCTIAGNTGTQNF